MRFASLFLTVFILLGCATGDKMADLEIGMKQSEVKWLLGKPDGVKAEGSTIWYKYNNRLASGWSWDRADYHVIFKNGKVAEFGQGEVRVKNNTMILIPVK